MFDGLLNKCANNSYDADIYARDFIWMTLNIIDYLINFKQFLEAERILSMFRTCGGFCEKPSGGFKPGRSCGCS